MASIHERTVDFLRDIATLVNAGGRFIYGREVHQSNSYPTNTKPSDEDGSPLISLLPFDVTVNTDPDANFDQTTVTLIFSRSADVQDNAEAEEAILNQMATLAENFVQVINEELEKPIQFDIGNVQLGPNYHYWLGTDSGYIASFTLNVKKNCNGGQPILIWILTGGTWNDNGVWIDGQTWID